ncbi:response regulator transcription factor [Pedobacter xixiisoli]|uniref:Response regulator receiver domain-containing protein n=1 Tax=Pedobacter xixiisoli TaxID=1476464 RepID=A0A285ZPH4_9SPHI|nr:response regulator [Pedobacter xixiisoli]SOD11544.1 Response regulator receiver domain-containing protein [Pedobacter xixiisoli]
MSKILIAEDEVLMLKALEFKLKKDGYQVDVASDGRQAMDKVKSETYDLILTDIMMPFVGGMEILSYIKNDPLKKSTPVLLISAVGLENVVLEGFSLGADDFIYKPFNLNELSVRIKRYIKQNVF